MGLERSLLELVQIVHDILRIDADRERRHLRVDQPAAHGHGGVDLAYAPSRHVTAGIGAERLQLSLQPGAGVRRLDGLAITEVVVAVESGQNPRPAVDLLEFLQIVPGSQVHAPVTMHPAIRPGSAEEDHALTERHLDLEDRPVLLSEMREECRQVSTAHMRVAQQRDQRDDRGRLGELGPSQQRAGDAAGDRGRD